MIISSFFEVISIEEGVALFNTFTGDTHFVRQPYASVLLLLIKKQRTPKALFNELQPKIDIASDTLNDELQQFLTQAIKSGIIIEK